MAHTLALGLLALAGLCSGSVWGPLADFTSPPTSDRPKFRYWFPDASIPTSAVRDDIQAIKDVGAGGLEFLSFYNYGQGPALTDWSAYGFGTAAFKALLQAALNASAEHGLAFDFALGPNQGQGVPSIPETTGLAYELVYGSAPIRAGQAFNGTVPPANPHFNYEGLASFINAPQLWGDNKLVAVVAAQVVSASTSGGRRRTVIKEASVVDLTAQAFDGHLAWTAPSGSAPYELFAFYERYTNEKNCISVDNATTALGNGSWMVDHFSADGAKKMTDFWDQHLFDDAETRALLALAGEYSWEDSLEMMASLWWTPGFLERFQKARGYNAIPCLPVMFQANNEWNGFSPPYNTTYVFDTDTAGNGGACNQDYKTTLNEGYQAYLQHLQAWAQSLGLGHSAQPAYNLPLDMMADVPFVEAPELESLGFSENIDIYKQLVGAAHLSGRNVVSTEIGAKSIGAYALTVPQLVGLFQGSYAAGVNTMVIHGFAYGGDYTGTTWPGYTPFQYRFTEMWGPRMPAWRHMNDTILYAARNTHVGKLGVPKVDLAFYVAGQSFVGREIEPAPELAAAGYTHEYLGASNLASAAATVSNGILAPDGPGYKALVLHGQRQITAAAAAAFVRFAEKGLPIVIVGDRPNVTFGASGQEDVSTYMEQLVGYQNVHTTPPEDFGPDLLAGLGITPRASLLSTVGGNATQVYSVWRNDRAAGVEAVFVYNRGPDSIFKMGFDAANGSIPWVLNAWTGEQYRVAVFARQNQSLVVDLDLKQGETTILAFAKAGHENDVHVSSCSKNVAAVRFNPAGSIEALVDDDGTEAMVQLSNGTRATIPAATGVPSITAGPWDLTIEAYVPPDRPATVKGRVQKLDTRRLAALAPWTQFPGLQNVSGVGTYATNISIAVGVDLSSSAVFLDLGPVHNTIRAWVNGHLVPPLDLARPVVEISDLVVPGTSELRIEVSSTLFNAVKSRLDSLRSAATAPDHPEYYKNVNYADFGLTGPVQVRFLRRITLA